MATISEQFAHFILSLNFKDIPEHVVERAKSLLLDTVGVSIYGADTDWTNATLRFASALGGREEATVFKHRLRTTAMGAALVNGTMSASYDYDDTAHSTHPSGIIIPATMAVAEKENLGGKDALVAAIAAYEVLIRIAESGNSFPEKGINRRGFHGHAVLGVFGAVVAAGKLLSLTHDEMVNAFGIAGSHASGLYEWLADGSWTKRYHSGKAAWQGVMAALLAKSGLTGPRTVFEGKNGFLRAFSDTTDPSKLLAGLGQEWRTVTRISTKFYMAGHDTHNPIHATLELVKEHELQVGQIREIVVKGATTSLREYCEPLEQKQNPQTLLEAQINIPFTMAVALVKGKVDKDTLTDETLADPIVKDVVKKIRPQGWPAYDADQHKYEYAITVDMALTDGRKVSKEVIWPRGSPRNPATMGDLEAKFRNCTKSFLKQDKSEEVIRTVRDLETLPRLRDLSSLLS